MRSLAAVIVTALLVAGCSGDGAVTPTEGNVSTGDPAVSTTMPAGTSAPGSSAGVESGGLTCWASPASGGSEEIDFSDQTEQLGLVDPLVGMHGHAAVWGDFDADGYDDLFVGTFAHRDAHNYQFRGASGPSPDRFLVAGSDSFTSLPDFPEMHTRTSGGAVGDFDNDGDLDLVLSRNWDDDMPDAPPTQILRNDGGTLVPVPDSGLPNQLGGRSVGVLDFDADGNLDLVIAEDRFSGGSSVLLRNIGGLRFEDATQGAGLPADIHGLGVAVADFNGDTHRDIFFSGSNRLFIATGAGAFTEADGSVFSWPIYGNEDDVAGSSVADVNRDGWLDLLVGQHYNSTVDDGVPVPVRLYLNRGPDGSGMPVFEDVTDAAGLVGLPTKAPHVELNDMDNDGWPDVVTTASASDGAKPAVFRHQGLSGDIPSFASPEGLGHPQYWVAGPTADIDHDGRLDMFLVEWEPSLPSLLLRNETASGHWLQVSAGSENGFGIGWRAEVYEAGGLDDPGSLLGAREITVTQGYSAGVAPVAHFGLGEHESVDLRLVPPNGGAPIEVTDLPSDQHVRPPDGC